MLQIVEVLQSLKAYEVWIYVLLGLIALIYLQKLFLAFRNMRAALFGIEREVAQRRFSTALTLVILLVLIASLEFTLVTFVVPNFSFNSSILPTATLNLLVTPTVTLASPQLLETTTPGANPTTVVKLVEGCIQGQIEWTYPREGEEISGKVQLKGTVNVANLGFYKYEYSQPGSDNWNTIAADNKNNKIDADIGQWDTTLMIPGDYLLRLVVADNQNQLLPACVVKVRIVVPQ
jgi:hypothetical protein